MEILILCAAKYPFTILALKPTKFYGNLGSSFPGKKFIFIQSFCDFICFGHALQMQYGLGYSVLAIRLRSEDLYHPILRSGLPELQG